MYFYGEHETFAAYVLLISIFFGQRTYPPDPVYLETKSSLRVLRDILVVLKRTNVALRLRDHKVVSELPPARFSLFDMIAWPRGVKKHRPPYADRCVEKGSVFSVPH